MRLALLGNCQVDGLHVFLARALPQYEIRRMPHLATFYGEFTEEQIAETCAWADVVFFHHKHDGAQNYATKHPKVALSVWFQSAPFIIQSHDEHWEVVRDYAKRHGRERAIEWAVKEMDMAYASRWAFCLARMMEKEVLEGVPVELRMSDWMEQGRAHQLQLTCNHPTSLVFREWALRICRFMGEPVNSQFFTHEECVAQPNLGGLPCEESATTAAVKHLGLAWGGREIDDESGRLVARQRLGVQ